MRYRVIATQTYKEEKKKWSKSDQKTTEKIEKKLTDNPYVGDQCQYKFLREKRVGGKRIYFLVYDDLKLVLLVATSGKKINKTLLTMLLNNLMNLKNWLKKFLSNLLPTTIPEVF